MLIKERKSRDWPQGKLWISRSHAGVSNSGINIVKSCCCSVTQSCLTLCDPMECSMPGYPVLHHLPEFAETHVESYRQLSSYKQNSRQWPGYTAKGGSVSNRIYLCDWKWKWTSTLCNPMDYTVHGILQARILEWVDFYFSRGFSLEIKKENWRHHWVNT